MKTERRCWRTGHVFAQENDSTCVECGLSWVHHKETASNPFHSTGADLWEDRYTERMFEITCSGCKGKSRVTCKTVATTNELECYCGNVMRWWWECSGS